MQALDHLFSKQHFSICTLQNVMEIVGAPRTSPAYKLLHALHCVDYADMRPELRNQIPQLVNECLRPPAIEIAATSTALAGVVFHPAQA